MSWAASPQDYRVLVADDDRRCRDSLTTLLDSQGFRTLALAGGQPVLEVVRQQILERRVAPEQKSVDPSEEIHFLVLDYNMPDLSGIEVLRQLRDELSTVLPTIFVSGEVSRHLEHDVREVGGFALVRKPVVPASFRELVWQLVRDRLLQ